MDRMIYTALNALAVARNEQVKGAQNLANQNVPGFRRDLPDDGGSRFLSQLEGLTTRAFQLEAGPARFSDATGFLEATGQELDVAIADRGYFYVEAEDGTPALSRRGDLRREVDGVLRNGAGEAMLGPDLAPVVIPEFVSLRISDIGEIFADPVDEPGTAQRLVGLLATTIPDPELVLTKGVDGQIRDVEGQVPPPNQQARVLAGTLEGSNVNPVEELLSTMEIQRSFERGLRLVMTAREIDENGARILQAPEG
ncbi:MAG: flagellar basal body rod C-terminal domain-containing protein [Pseudomonadota bacterium]